MIQPPDDNEPLSRSKRKYYFVQNLRLAIHHQGWTLVEAAAKFGVNYPWLRRAATQGIAWTHHGNLAVERIANHFGCETPLLWSGNGGFQEHYFLHYRSTRTAPEAQLATVLAHYAGRGKPPLLINALTIIARYYDYTKDAREPDEDQIKWLLEVVEFLGGRGPIVNALIQAIEDTAKLFGESLPFHQVEAAAELYFDRIGVYDEGEA